MATTASQLDAETFREPTTPVKVLLADDHPLIIAGIRHALERYDDIEIVGDAASAMQLLHLVERRRPDVVLMDLNMPGNTNSECIEAIRDRWPTVKIVVLSACDDAPTIDACLAAGAHTYVVKSATTTDVASVIRQASTGAVFHAPVRASASPLAAVEPALPVLTERESTIMVGVVAGKTTASISRELWVSEHTVKFHLTNIYRKLGVSNRASAVRYALEHGLVN